MSIKGFSVGGNVERYDYNALDNIPSEITIDTALSGSSTNPVQNKVVTGAINATTDSVTALSGEVSELKSALPPIENAVTSKYSQTLSKLGQYFIKKGGALTPSTSWRIYGKTVTPAERYDLKTYFNTRGSANSSTITYGIYNSNVTLENYTTTAIADNLIASGKAYGGADTELAESTWLNENGIVIPANGAVILITCTGLSDSYYPTLSLYDYISSAELRADVDGIVNGVSITWNAGKALTTAGTLVDHEGYSASNLIQLTNIVKGATFKNIRQRISYTIVPICFYNASGAFIGYYTDADAGNNAAITVTIADILDNYAGATQIRIGKSDSDNVVVDSSSLDSLNNRVTALEEAYPPYNITAYPKIICCGDSVTYGYVVEGTQDDPSQIYKGIPAQSYPSCIGRIIGNDITTKAQSGITVKQFYETLYPTVTWTDYNLAIFELGLNPGGEGYLSINDINTPGKSAYIYRQMIAAIRSAAPNLTIVLMRSSAHMASGQAVLEYIANESDCLVINLADSKYINLNDTKYHGWFDNNGTPTFDDTHFTRIGYSAKAYDILCWLGVLLPN